MSSKHPPFLSKGECERSGPGSFLLQGVKITPRGARGVQVPNPVQLQSCFTEPSFMGLFHRWVWAENWLELFSSRLISAEFANFEKFALLKPGPHLSLYFPSQMILLSAHYKPITSSGCCPRPFFPQHLEVSAPQHFCPKREKQTEARNPPRKHWGYSLVDFFYILYMAAERQDWRQSYKIFLRGWSGGQATYRAGPSLSREEDHSQGNPQAGTDVSWLGWNGSPGPWAGVGEVPGETGQGHEEPLTPSRAWQSNPSLHLKDNNVKSQ